MSLSEGDRVRATWKDSIQGGQFHGKHLEKTFTGTVQGDPFSIGLMGMKRRVNVKKDDSEKVFTVSPANCEHLDE